jgi:hypothetical protein
VQVEIPDDIADITPHIFRAVHQLPAQEQRRLFEMFHKEPPAGLAGHFFVGKHAELTKLKSLVRTLSDKGLLDTIERLFASRLKQNRKPTKRDRYARIRELRNAGIKDWTLIIEALGNEHAPWIKTKSGKPTKPVSLRKQFESWEREQRRTSDKSSRTSDRTTQEVEK